MAKTLSNADLQKTLLTRLAPGHKLCNFIELYQTLQNAPNAKQTLTDGQDTNNRVQKCYWPD